MSGLRSCRKIGVARLIGINRTGACSCDGDGMSIGAATSGNSIVGTGKDHRIARITAGGRNSERSISIYLCIQCSKCDALTFFIHSQCLLHLVGSRIIGVARLIGVNRAATRSCDGDGCTVGAAAGGHTGVRTGKDYRIARGAAGGRNSEWSITIRFY